MTRRDLLIKTGNNISPLVSILALAMRWWPQPPAV